MASFSDALGFPRLHAFRDLSPNKIIPFNLKQLVQDVQARWMRQSLSPHCTQGARADDSDD